MRNLEEVIIRTCSDFGLNTGRSEGRTGVWIGPDAQGLERKICAMGIRCSRWVTMHGFALNVTTDLDYFGHIVPCGLTRPVTSMERLLGRTPERQEVLAALVRRFGEVFERTMRSADRGEIE